MLLFFWFFGEGWAVAELVLCISLIIFVFNAWTGKKPTSMPRLLLNIVRCVAEKSRLPDSFAFVKRRETSEGRLSVRPRFILIRYVLLGGYKT